MSASDRIRDAIRDVPDFPKPGIVFKDLTPILNRPEVFHEVLDLFEGRWREAGLDAIAGIEARGFLFGAPLADRLGLPFVPVRKAGKLPAAVHRLEYALEYGTDTIEIHRDAFPAGARVLVLDDLLATGGTAAATAELVERAGGVVAGVAFVVNLAFLDGAAKLAGRETHFLVEYA
jgi:adenine phosphoribosyltransferase